MQEVESLLYWLCKTRLPLRNLCTDRDTPKETQGWDFVQVYRILMQEPEKKIYRKISKHGSMDHILLYCSCGRCIPNEILVSCMCMCVK